jgi:hypothetical protein
LFLPYVVNILDRINVGFARVQMLDDLQMGERPTRWEPAFSTSANSFSRSPAI